MLPSLILISVRLAAMRIASWNVNSVRQRTEHLVAWLKETSPDIVCLQELKCTEDTFPTAEIESLGYNIAVLGQKTFNGVALLSKYQLEDVTRGLPGDDQDEQARYIEALVSLPQGVVRIVSLYLPNGNPLGTEKYTYKIAWFDRLIARARHLLTLEEPLVLAGDYNVIPAPSDAKDPASWLNDALFIPQTRAKFQELLNLGFTDAFRACSDHKGAFTFWDYQAGAWPKNNGIRIDHLLLSPQAADKLVACEIDKHVRAWEKPSDHVPIRADITV